MRSARRPALRRSRAAARPWRSSARYWACWAAAWEIISCEITYRVCILAFISVAFISLELNRAFTVPGLFDVYHLALSGCNALPRQDDAHDTFTRTFNFVQVRVNRLKLLNATCEGPEVCIGEETFRKARAVGWGLSSRPSRC